MVEIIVFFRLVRPFPIVFVVEKLELKCDFLDSPFKEKQNANDVIKTNCSLAHRVLLTI